MQFLCNIFNLFKIIKMLKKKKKEFAKNNKLFIYSVILHYI